MLLSAMTYTFFPCPVNILYICVINDIKHTINLAKSWNTGPRTLNRDGWRKGKA